MELGAKSAARTVVDKAKAGDLKAARFLLEHVEATNEQGETIRPLAAGVDSRSETFRADPSADGPRILIGIGLGADFAQLDSRSTTRPGDRHALAAPVVSHTVSDTTPTRKIIDVSSD